MEECYLLGFGVVLILDYIKNEVCEDGVSDLVCFVSGLFFGINVKFGFGLEFLFEMDSREKERLVVLFFGR